MAAKARWRLGDERVLIGRLEDLPLAPGSFDVITAISFLEHDPQPAKLLGQAFNLLRPGGALFIKVPNYDSLLRRWRGTHWSGYRWPEHVQYFTPGHAGPARPRGRLRGRRGLRAAPGRQPVADRAPVAGVVPSGHFAW
jgi:SAM-dependent methyltransferase